MATGKQRDPSGGKPTPVLEPPGGGEVPAATRRDLLRWSAAVAGLAACSRPREEIVPYARAPEHAVLPGRSVFLATALLHQGFAAPVVAEVREGRPIKVEGNPEHPASRGATDAFAQAEVLSLYDPERSRAVRHAGRVASWSSFERTWAGALARARERRGRGLRVLTGNLTSPTALGLLRGLLAELPEARWHRHEPVDDAGEREGTRTALGRPLALRPRPERARRILALAADPLFEQADRVRLTRELAEARRAWRREPPEMARLYAVEPAPTLTGSKADHRLPLRAREVGGFALVLARELGLDVPWPRREVSERERVWAREVAADLRAHAREALVLVGRGQPGWVHALGLAMAAELGSLGHTMEALPPLEYGLAGEAGGEPPLPLASLAEAMHAGEVETLVVLEGDPAYDAPADLRFADALARVPLAVHAGAWRNATARRCAWHLPLAHALESWGDARSPDGLATVLQPAIRPLFRGRPPVSVLATLAGREPVSDRELVRRTWSEAAAPARGGAGGGALAGEAFERRWREALLLGYVPGSAPEPAAELDVDRGAVRAAAERGVAESAGAHGTEVVWAPDDTIWDGRYAPNAWLQELPKPLTKLTWSNAALLSPREARRRRVAEGDVVRLRLHGREVEAPVLPLPGVADGCVVVTLGYGRERLPLLATTRGYDAYRLRTAARPWFDHGLAVEHLREPKRVHLARTQHHARQEGRHLLRYGTLRELERDPRRLAEPHPVPPGAEPHQGRLEARLDPPGPREGIVATPSLLPEWVQSGEQWGMAIDLGACVGCGVCTIACQAENNVPVVGEEQVRIGREMHWIRVDRYFEGPEDDPTVHHQPVPCMHCEKAPCEVVCPVGATQHSSDGLNDMVYNRCVGTRYCSNNCPYQVRRFNFLRYVPEERELTALQRNPDVTVRGRGVMEKCTYCVQRIRRAQVRARVEDRPLADGEVVTACQAACPAQAIVFGNIADPASEVRRWKDQPHDYGMLADLGTQPRTTYLAEVRHPNEALVRREEALGG